MQEYEPFFMRWRRALGPWLKSTLAPESKRARRWWWNRVFVQVPQAQSAEESREALLGRLQPHVARSGEVLAEAKTAFAEPFERADGVERRATTLQGAVAIAASFVLTGGGFVLDTSEIRSDGWRIALAAVYALVILSLVFCGLRALRATSRVLVWHYVDGDTILENTGTDQAQYELALAADLLYATRRNSSNARYKVAQMRAAGHWFGLALVGLLLTALTVCAYVLWGPT